MKWLNRWLAAYIRKHPEIIDLDAIELEAWQRGRAYQDFDPAFPVDQKYAARVVSL